jgi:hypothetical protein
MGRIVGVLVIALATTRLAGAADIEGVRFCASPIRFGPAM